MKMIRPFLLLALVAGLAAGVPALRAQAPAEHPQTQEGARPEGHEAKAEGHEGKGHEVEGEAPEPPEIRLLGHDLKRPGQFGIQLFNFALFAGLIFVLLKGALASAFKARAKELEDKLSQAERDKAEADSQIRELEARMTGLQAELEGIMAKAETEAQAEKERIIHAAQGEAAQILAQTLAEIDYQKRAAEAELRDLVAELAVEGATRRLQNQVTGEVASRVLDRSIQQVGGAK